jgi:putative ABC transport system permease protein
MRILPFVPLVLKQVWRHRVRTILTITGIAIAMFLFTSVQAMQKGVADATRATAKDTALVVYRKDRFCPATSTLPHDYGPKIARIEGVASVLPMKIVVSNCRASLDVVTFRGVPKDEFLADRGERLKVIAGSIADWQRRTDAALLGETLANRRGLRPGMSFDAAGITVYVAGIVRSEDPQDQNVAYTALEFLQLASRDDWGLVTQFIVKVDDPARLSATAQIIDEMFRTAQDPTATSGEKAFVGRIAEDIIELVGFARWLGIGCLAAVLALVGNSIVLGVQSRIAEHAVLQTLGFSGPLVAGLIIAEGVVVALAGGIIGAIGAVAMSRVGSFALSVEGQSIPVVAGPWLLVAGLGVCGSIGVVAGLVPGVQAARREIAASLRAV